MLSSATIDTAKWVTPLALGAIGIGALFAVEAHRLHGVEDPAAVAELCGRMRDDAARVAGTVGEGDLGAYAVLSAIVSTHRELCGRTKERARLRERVADGFRSG